MSGRESATAQIVEAITAPLGFFVLALLIVEAFLATVLIGGELESSARVTGMYVGVALFVIVTVIVSVFVWFKPDNLTFDKEAHLRNMQKPPFGSSSNPSPNPDALVPGAPQERL